MDVEHQQRVSHLLGPLPKEMRNDTAFMDRIHAYLPGWDVPKMETALFTDHFGLVSDFLSESWTQLRAENRIQAIQNRVPLWWGVEWSRHDRGQQDGQRPAQAPLSRIATMPIADEDLEWAVRLGLECRRRVKEQQKRIGAAEFRNTHFSYQLGDDGVEQFVVTPELQSENTHRARSTAAGTGLGDQPRRDGRESWSVPTRGQRESGSGVKIINVPVPGPFRESVKTGEQNLFARAKDLVGDRDPRQHEFIIAAARVRCLAVRRGPWRARIAGALQRTPQQESQRRIDHRRRTEPRRRHLSRSTTRSASPNLQSKRAPRRSSSPFPPAGSSTTSPTTWPRRSPSYTTPTQERHC